MRLLTWNELEHIYHTAMQTDFPAAERKPLSLLKRRFEEGLCCAYGYFRGEQLCAYAVFQKPTAAGLWLLDYLAVDAAQRGNGIGGQFLAEMKATLPTAALIGEIERVSDALTPEQVTERTRRRAFYLRNGWQATSLESLADGGIRYEIIVLPIQDTPTTQTVAEGLLTLYASLFEPDTFAVYPKN